MQGFHTAMLWAVILCIPGLAASVLAGKKQGRLTTFTVKNEKVLAIHLTLPYELHFNSLTWPVFLLTAGALS